MHSWLHHFYQSHSPKTFHRVRDACYLSQLAGEEQPTFTGQSCLQQGLAMAEILGQLQLDQDCIAAAIVNDSIHYGDLSLDDVREQLGETVTKLVQGTRKMEASNLLHQPKFNLNQTENVRMMLLAMVEDMRIVLIKLAERICIMRNIGILGEAKQKQLAQESLQIYAPLASRLGASMIKWELEDRSFRYLDHVSYKKIAKLLASRRLDREHYLQDVITTLKQQIQDRGIKDFQVTGRIKHIYGIYRKMQRKHVDYDQIYDACAVRVLVNSIEDCYNILSLVHELWQQIPCEFDNYIASPKPNGYRSIHTAVRGPENNKVEVQIRTHDMHYESEMGIAAHWIYKEGRQPSAAHEAKIAWLRQVLEWQKELSQHQDQLLEEETPVANDRIYVFTPTGEVIDLVTDATPLDFAYRIHTEVGHRCRGAKVNGVMVNLTSTLKTGDQVEVLTANRAHPSLDWLSPHLGYLKTARAKAKVHQWFKLQNYEQNVSAGEQLLEQECKRLNLGGIDWQAIAQRYNFKSITDMHAGLGCGDLRLGQVIGMAQTQLNSEKPSAPLPPTLHSKNRARAKTHDKDIQVEGVDNLLTHMAKCCQPTPGDIIIGFVTLGRGVSIHRQDCENILNATATQRERFIEVEWQQRDDRFYPLDIDIIADHRPDTIKKITELLQQEQVQLQGLHHTISEKKGHLNIRMTIAIRDLASLSRLLNHLQQLPPVIQVKRRH